MGWAAKVPVVEPLSLWTTHDGGKTYRVLNKKGVKVFTAASFGVDRMDLEHGGKVIRLRPGEMYEAPFGSMRGVWIDATG